MDPTQPQACSVCRVPLQVNWNFCPNCGNPLHQPPVSTSVLSQLGIYSLSFFLPPFGIMPAIKYLKQKDAKAKIIGMVAIILTILSVLAIILLYKNLMDRYAKVINSFPYPYNMR